VSIQDFDNLTAALANRAISRKRALQMAAASALGAAGLGLAAGEAHATHNECPRRGHGCCRDCTHTGGRQCVCVKNVAGKRRCVRQCCPTTVRQCNSNAECPSGDICIRKGSCARCLGTTASDPNKEGVCMRRCDSGAENCTSYSC